MPAPPNIDTPKPAPSQDVEIGRCGFCSRPWFGAVAFCPYCGRKSDFAGAKQELKERPAGDEYVADVFVANEHATMWKAADPPHQQEAAPPPPKESRRARPQAAPPEQPGRTAPSRVDKPMVMLLLTTVIAGIGALLLIWGGIELLAYRAANEEASIPQPMANSSMGAAPAPTVRAEPAPSVPSPSTDTAPQRPAPPRAGAASPRTDTAVQRNPSNSLCSPASEAAGLCKSQ